VTVTLERSTWRPQPVFDLVAEVGNVERTALEQTLNCGVGMVALVDAEDVNRVLATLQEHGVESWVCGDVRLATTAEQAGRVTLVGDHP
jgi:phosphoribosylformylglycinamidine cyclo-ligase